MPTRWASTLLCTLVVGASALVGSGVGAASASSSAPPSVPRAVPSTASPAPPGASPAPLLTLTSQTSFVTPTQPWFNLALAVAPRAGAASGLHVSLTFYGRINDASALEQAIGGALPSAPLLRLNDVPVAGAGTDLTATACVTVVPEAGTAPPASGLGACTAGSPTLSLDCRPLLDTCDDVYPVTISLTRNGTSQPLAHFTTFITYEQPLAVGPGGPLRVGLVVPVGPHGVAGTASALAQHPAIATTLAVSPQAVGTIEQRHQRTEMHALAELAGLSGDEVLGQPYVPVNVAALSQAGIPSEIAAQVTRGDDLLRAAYLKPKTGSWTDVSSSFTQGDATNLAEGLRTAGASRLVLSDDDLPTGGLSSSSTFAQPFNLDLGHGASIPTVAADSALGARFSAQPGDPVLGAQQLLASLAFVHYEDPFPSEAKGVVVVPPSGWRPSAGFLNALFDGLAGNAALSPVTLDQFFAQVPVGGNEEPSVRRLQVGPTGRGLTRSAADHIAADRLQLSSFTGAVHVHGYPATLDTLSDRLLATESRRLSTAGRAGALAAYARSFSGTTGEITLATERTVTLTSQRAAIPVTVLSAAPYPVRVVVTLASDKFLFPDGNSRRLTLDRPTTSVRVTAQARTSGDRLPIDVTLHTPDGQLLIAHTVLTVHSTAISFVGVALTVLAGAVLVVWWVRTWRRSRRRARRLSRAP